MKNYTGTEPYLFCLCAEEDAELVASYVQAMQQHTFRIYFHHSSELSTQDLQECADHMKGSKRILIFISQKAMNCPEFQSTLHYALSLNKDILVVYLEDVQLTAGYSLLLSNVQNLYKTRQPSEEVFLNELINANLLQPCKEHTNSDAYEGRENYVFISYAHKDDHAVLPIIKALTMSGFRVWYDSSIKVGSEWPDDIEYHLDHCIGVLAFISPSSVSSQNCRNEINYALGLKKDVMVVYLEPTKLIKGLGVQLSSVQSINKYSFTTNEAFFEKLFQTELLQHCHTSYVVTETNSTNSKIEDTIKALQQNPDFLYSSNVTDRHLIKEMRKNGPSLISNIATIASNDPQNPWPLGSYSQVISPDKNTVVFLHARLLTPQTQDGTHAIGLYIYDSDDILVHKNITSLVFSKGNDHFSLGWIIREASGMKQRDGIYTALIWYDNSRVVEYKFRLLSQVSRTIDPIIKNSPDNLEIEKRQLEIKKVIRQQKYPLLFFINILAWVLLYVGFGISTFSDIAILMLLPIIAAFAVTILLVEKTRKYVVPYTWLAVIIVFAGCGLYTAFLGLMGLISLIRRKELKKRLEALVNPFDN